MSDLERLIKEVEHTEFTKIKYAIVDIDGVLRAKYISKEKLLKGLQQGLGFCDVIFGWDCQDECYDNASFTGWHTSFPDAMAFPDWSTLRSIPWQNNDLFVLADFSKENKFVPCPRALLKKVNDEALNMGYKVIAAQEFEWFNFKANQDTPSPITSGMFGYSLLRFSEQYDYVNDLWEKLSKFDVSLEGFHTETGPGVYEGALEKADLLAAADKATLFKTAVKEIAHQHDIKASFMAKWNYDLPGCSGHIHQSLWDIDKSKNLFFDADADDFCSDTMKHYIAGQLYCLPFILPFYAPTINSYKRLIDGAWAPTTVSWGIENRTTALRVIGNDSNSHRVEMRVAGSDCNPYLAMAASIASGLYGIKNKLSLQDVTTGNAYANNSLKRIPKNLEEATEAMKSSEIAQELFGEEFITHFAQTREWECKQYHNQVSNWELNRYFEII